MSEVIENVVTGALGDKIDEEDLQETAPQNIKSDLAIRISKFEAFEDTSSESYTEEIFFDPKVCPICSEEYKPGDDIAWSKNEDCIHAFHTNCIVPWLMDHDDCPMCRNDYIFV